MSIKNLISKKTFDAKNYYIPVVCDKQNGHGCSDVFSRLLKDRIIFITGPIEEEMSSIVVAELLFLESDDSESDIYLYIDSPGGSVIAGMAIYDTMQLIRPDVSTICIGQACSMAAFLLCAGARYKRFALPNATILIHQPFGGYEGQISDIEIHVEELIKIKSRLIRLMAIHTNQDEETIYEDTERDRFMSSYEAAEYGIIDCVLRSRKRNPIIRG